MTEKVRPTKKQKELLDFIAGFITEHGYSPSYREIMTALNYTSVATVALHVGSLIKRGHLVKRDRSARSLEVVNANIEAGTSMEQPGKADEAKWLIDKVEQFFKQAEEAVEIEEAKLDELFVLIGSLKVLGFHEAVQQFIPRLSSIKQQATIK